MIAKINTKYRSSLDYSRAFNSIMLIFSIATVGNW